MTTYVHKYRIPGQLPDAAMAEIRRVCILQNHQTRTYLNGDDVLAGLYERATEITDAQETADDARLRVKGLRDAIKARKARDRSARPDPQLTAELTQARAVAAAAAGHLRDAKKAVRDADDRRILASIRAEQDEQIKALYGPSGDGTLYAGDPVLAGYADTHGLFWASYNAVTAKRRTAFGEVIKARSRGQASQMRFRSWKGGAGTIAVQLQRQLGGRVTVTIVTVNPERGKDLARPETRATVTGTEPRFIAVAVKGKDDGEGLRTHTVTFVNWGEQAGHVTASVNVNPLTEAGEKITGPVQVTAPDGTVTEIPPGADGTITWAGPLRGGPPLRTPARVEDPDGPWHAVALLIPHPSPGGAPWQARRAALRFRIRQQNPGSPPHPHHLDDEAATAVTMPHPDEHGRLRYAPAHVEECGTCAAAWVTVPVIMHRPLPEDAEITRIEITCRREGSTVRASAAITVNVPDPAPQTGGVIAVHGGWRSLPDGALRVAVIRGPSTPPPDLAWVVPARRSGPATRHPATRPLGGACWELVIPASARDLLAKADSLQGIRSREMDKVRLLVTTHLAGHPSHKELLDPDGTLHAWRSPGRFRHLAAAAAALEGETGQDLTAALTAWAAQDLHLERWLEGNRQRFFRWREAAFRTTAAWAVAAAGTVTADEWSMRRRRPDPETEETGQEKAGRSNARIAAPGDFRATVLHAAARRGCRTVTSPAGVSTTHHQCPVTPPGTLDASARSQHHIVTCPACSRQIDQDINATAGMEIHAASDKANP